MTTLDMTTLAGEKGSRTDSPIDQCALFLIGCLMPPRTRSAYYLLNVLAMTLGKATRRALVYAGKPSLYGPSGEVDRPLGYITGNLRVHGIAAYRYDACNNQCVLLSTSPSLSSLI